MAFVVDPEVIRNLIQVYGVNRHSLEPGKGVKAALHDVLQPAEFADVIKFMDGKLDDVYGDGKSQEFADDFGQRLEGAYQKMLEQGVRYRRPVNGAANDAG